MAIVLFLLLSTYLGYGCPSYIFVLLLDKLQDKSDFLYVIYCLEEDSVALALRSIMIRWPCI